MVAADESDPLFSILITAFDPTDEPSITDRINDVMTRTLLLGDEDYVKEYLDTSSDAQLFPHVVNENEDSSTRNEKKGIATIEGTFRDIYYAQIQQTRRESSKAVLRHICKSQIPHNIYAASRFQRKGERFSNQVGTCLPDAGLPDRNADAVNAELEAVAVPVPKLVIRQLQALLILLTSAEHPPKKNIFEVIDEDGVTGLTAFVPELEATAGVLVAVAGAEVEVGASGVEAGVGVLVLATFVVVLIVELAVLELVMIASVAESGGDVEVDTLMLDDELSGGTEGVDIVDGSALRLLLDGTGEIVAEVERLELVDVE
ncbi:hypothetical protein PV04_01110 [Phialophora macrospora]|uniref:Uncharacterized protein n=1 Tax=Phialophora macrospora TaxID=1851006 RepID=A0A0D2GKP5_9EURO|nr:hypothetical protein PV04_01110 [Phialophora macrospora]